MKNNLIKQLCERIASENEKIHIILDKVVDVFVTQFSSVENGPQLVFLPRDTVFVSDIDNGIRVAITRDFAQFGVTVSVVNSDGSTLAECRLDTNNQFSETFGRMPAELKTRIRKLFDAISEIDINAPDEVEAVSEETPDVSPSEVDAIEPQA